jgi:hypothetical protein
MHRPSTFEIRDRALQRQAELKRGYETVSDNHWISVGDALAMTAAQWGLTP